MTKILWTSALAGLSAMALAQGAQAKNFDGFYVGLQSGLRSSETTINHEDTTLVPCGFICFPIIVRTPETAVVDHGSTFDYGLFAGWNGRFGDVVLGLEGDVDFRTGGGEVIAPLSKFTYAIDEDLSYSARARAGVLLTEELLAFVTVGYHSSTAAGSAGDSGGGPFEFDADAAGLTFGGGVELALGGGLSGRIEYRRAEGENYAVSPTHPLGTYLPQSIETGGSDSVKLGLSIAL